MVDSVKFDPGMGELVVSFNEYVNEVYSQLMAFRTIHQKRARFKLCSKKIEKFMANNIAFYLGCLLWAYYIVTSNSEEPKTITGSIFEYMSDDDKKNFDYLLQVNFMENYFESYERDVLYYTGKKYSIPQQWKNILSLYTEFLTLNDGLVNVKMTSDIKLPEMLKNIKYDGNIETLINKAIDDKNLESLLQTSTLT